MKKKLNRKELTDRKIEAKRDKFVNTGPEFLEFLEGLLKCKCPMIKSCRECRNFDEKIAPKALCTAANKYIDNPDEFPAFCPYETFGAWYKDLEELKKDNYIRAHGVK